MNYDGQLINAKIFLIYCEFAATVRLSFRSIFLGSLCVNWFDQCWQRANNFTYISATRWSVHERAAANTAVKRTKTTSMSDMRFPIYKVCCCVLVFWFVT